jgi:hypothetical protein
LEKSISGISCSEAALGSAVRLRLFAFFISLPFRLRGSSRAYDPHDIVLELDADDEENPRAPRRTDRDDSWFAVLPVCDEQNERVIEHRLGVLEGDTVLPTIARGLARVPVEDYLGHQKLVLRFLCPRQLPPAFIHTSTRDGLRKLDQPSPRKQPPVKHRHCYSPVLRRLDDTPRKPLRPILIDRLPLLRELKQRDRLLKQDQIGITEGVSTRRPLGLPLLFESAGRPFESGGARYEDVVRSGPLLIVANRSRVLGHRWLLQGGPHRARR